MSSLFHLYVLGEMSRAHLMCKYMEYIVINASTYHAPGAVSVVREDDRCGLRYIIEDDQAVHLL